jgi:hypothetical protein
LACLALGVSIAWLMSATKRWQKIAAVLSLILIFTYNLVLAGRTLVVMAIILFCCAYVHLIWGSKDFKRKFGLFIAIVSLLSIGAFSYELNIFNVKNIVEGSNLYKRFFGDYAIKTTEDGRMELKIAYLKNMWGNFWGGSKIKDEIVGGFAHDIYLDVYDQAGIFGFIAILCYIGNTIYRFVLVIKNKSLDFKYRQLILCLYLVCYLEFVVEPILYGMNWLFIAFCFIDGLVASYIKDNRNYLLSKRSLHEDSANKYGG